MAGEPEPVRIRLDPNIAAEAARLGAAASASLGRERTGTLNLTPDVWGRLSRTPISMLGGKASEYARDALKLGWKAVTSQTLQSLAAGTSAGIYTKAILRGAAIGLPGGLVGAMAVGGGAGAVTGALRESIKIAHESRMTPEQLFALQARRKDLKKSLIGKMAYYYSWNLEGTSFKVSVARVGIAALRGGVTGAVGGAIGLEIGEMLKLNQQGVEAAVTAGTGQAKTTAKEAAKIVPSFVTEQVALGKAAVIMATDNDFKTAVELLKRSDVFQKPFKDVTNNMLAQAYSNTGIDPGNAASEFYKDISDTLQNKVNRLTVQSFSEAAKNALAKNPDDIKGAVEAGRKAALNKLASYQPSLSDFSPRAADFNPDSSDFHNIIGGTKQSLQAQATALARSAPNVTSTATETTLPTATPTPTPEHLAAAFPTESAGPTHIPEASTATPTATHVPTGTPAPIPTATEIPTPTVTTGLKAAGQIPDSGGPNADELLERARQDAGTLRTDTGSATQAAGQTVQDTTITGTTDIQDAGRVASAAKPGIAQATADNPWTVGGAADQSFTGAASAGQGAARQTAQAAADNYGEIGRPDQSLTGAAGAVKNAAGEFAGKVDHMETVLKQGITIDTGSNPWSSLAEVFRTSADRPPSPIELMELTRAMCQDNNIAVSEWGITGAISDRNIPPGTVLTLGKETTKILVRFKSGN